MSTWPFSDPQNAVTYVSRHVLDGELICHAFHSWEDASWSFLPDRDTEDGDCRLVCLKHIYERDPSVGELADLPYGWKASRLNRDDPWVREKNHPYAHFAEHGYYLIEAALHPTVYPDVPSQDRRKAIQVGELVQLLFRFASETQDFQPYDTERMWVTVIERDEDNYRYRGILENDPKHEGAIACGHEVWFHESHVFKIYEPQEG